MKYLILADHHRYMYRYAAVSAILILGSAFFWHITGFKKDPGKIDGPTPFYDNIVAFDGLKNVLETKARSTGQMILSPGLKMEPDTTLFDPEKGEIIFEQEAGPGNWVGAPGTMYDEADGQVYLYTRTRDRQERGGKAEIWNTSDGDSFEKVWEVEKQELDALSIEGGTLRKMENGSFQLFISYQEASTRRWVIASATAENISELRDFEKIVIDTEYAHLKDPVVHGDTLYVYATNLFFTDSDVLALNLSDRGESGKLEFGDVEHFEPRLNSIIDRDGRQIAFYDWRPTYFHVTAERTFYGFKNGSRIDSKVPVGKALMSAEGSGSLRYVSAEKVGEQLWIFYEKAEEDGSHQLYLQKLDFDVLDIE